MADPGNLERLDLVYGPTTWDVYDLLDVSLDPLGSDQLHDIADALLNPGDRVLDAGCRDGDHLIRIAERHEITGLGVEPVRRQVEAGLRAAAAGGVDRRISLTQGVINDLPARDEAFDFIWCRDVIEQVDQLESGLNELARVLRPGGTLLVYTTFATDLLCADERSMLSRHMGNVMANLDRMRVEELFDRSGLRAERVWEIGSEWREQAEEQHGAVSTSLLRLSRLRRRRSAIVAAHGREVYEHVEANLHWEVYQFLGKLEPVVYELRPRSSAISASSPRSG